MPVQANPPAIIQPAPPEDRLRAARWLILGAGTGADEVSTELALRRPNTYERNPLLHGGMDARIALKAGAVAVEGYALDHFARRHPRLANVIGMGSGTALGILAIRNLRQGK